MDEGVLYGLMAFSSVLGGGGFVGGFLKKSIFWALFPFFGGLVAWLTYVQLGKDGAIIVGYGVNSSGVITPIPQDPGIMALVVGFLIILNFLILFIIAVRKR